MRNKVGCGIVAVIAVIWVWAAVVAVRDAGKPGADGYTWRSSRIHGLQFPSFVQDIAVSPSGSVFVAVIGSGIFRSTDGGKSWESASGTMYRGSVSSVMVNKKGAVFTGTGRGMYRSTDNGDTWQLANNGLPTTVPKSFAEDKEGSIYIGCSDGYVFRSSDSGDHWIRVKKGKEYGPNVDSIGITRKGAILIGMSYRSLLCSTNNGKTWTDLAARWYPPRIDRHYTFHSIAIDADGRIYVSVDVSLWAGGKSKHESYIIRSSDSGNHWTRLYPGPKDTRCNCVAVNCRGLVFAGTDCGLFVSADHGRHWSSTGRITGLRFFSLVDTAPRIVSIAVDSRDRIYAVSSSGQVLCGTPGTR